MSLEAGVRHLLEDDAPADPTPDEPEGAPLEYSLAVLVAERLQEEEEDEPATFFVQEIPLDPAAAL